MSGSAVNQIVSRASGPQRPSAFSRAVGRAADSQISQLLRGPSAARPWRLVGLALTDAGSAELPGGPPVHLGCRAVDELPVRVSLRAR